MQNIITPKTLANLKLKQWQNSLNFNPLEKNSYEELTHKINKNILFPGSLNQDISIPLLLSMIVELKNELENVQDKFEITRLRDFQEL